MKKVAVVVLILLLVYAMPLLFGLLLPQLGNNLLATVVYKSVVSRETREAQNDWEVVQKLNSWVYLVEEQNSWLTIKDDCIDYDPLLDMVRGVGWCDQKASALANLLEQIDIKTVSLAFPSHTIALVTVNGEERTWDQSFNTELVHDSNGRLSRMDSKAYAGDVINSETPVVWGRGWTMAMTAKLVSLYPEWIRELWVSAFLCSPAFDPSRGITGNQKHSSEYSSPKYRILYEGRIYHLLGDYDKADAYYKKLLNHPEFKDEAVFFLIALSLDLKDAIAVDYYTTVSQGLPERDDYLSFIPLYKARFAEVYGE